jgi:hypothetical protein
MALVIVSLVALCTAALAAGSYGVVNLPAPGLWEPVGVTLGKIQQIDVAGSAVATGTVIISSVSADGALTNALYTATCSGGKVTAVLSSTNTAWVVAGERILRSGTATNGAVRIIVAQ